MNTSHVSDLSGSSRKGIPRPALSETNMRTHPPRLLSSLDSIMVVATCRNRLTTTHAAVVSALVGGHSRNDVGSTGIWSEGVLRSLRRRFRCQTRTPSRGSTLTVGRYGWQVCRRSRVAVVSCKAARSLRVQPVLRRASTMAEQETRG